jgi:hypothetical protein
MADIGIGEFLKKRFGSSASRDKRMTLSGTFGTEGSRKKQRERLAEQPSSAKPKAARKRGEAKRDAGKPDYMSQVSANALKKFQDKERSSASAAPKPKPAAPKAAAPKAAAPKAAAPKAAAPKPRGPSEMKSFMADFGKDSDNAVMKKLRERAAMSAKERDEAPKFESQYADKLNKALGYAKGGHVKADGCAKKGKTRGRII